MIYDNVVVGSGFSALGCIIELLNSNKKVLCIDKFNNLNQDKEIDNSLIYDRQNLPLKNLGFEEKTNTPFDPLKINESYSFGGLSNLWGAKCTRYFPSEFETWSIKYKDLEKFYEKCEKILHVDHFNDFISKELKIKKETLNDKKLNIYSEFIKKMFARQKEEEDFVYGFSRVAINNKCYKCGNCYFGCPDNYIFKTKYFFQKLIDEKKIDFKYGLDLKEFELKNNNIYLKFKNSEKDIITKRLFLGAGTIQTTKIIINSLKIKEGLNIKESQCFFIPCFYLGKNIENIYNQQTAGDGIVIFKENKHLNTKNLYHHFKYDQKLLEIVLKHRFGILYYLIPKFIVKRIFIDAGLIHSDMSLFKGKIKYKNENIEVIKNNIKKKFIKNIINKQLKTIGKKFKFLPINFLLKLGKFGRSFHLGSSIPMQDDKMSIQQENLFVKTNGELSLAKNIFVIDSTSFNNVPAGDFSITIMANAMRIADQLKNEK